MASDVIGYRVVLIATQLALGEVEGRPGGAGSYYAQVVSERECIYQQETI